MNVEEFGLEFKDGHEISFHVGYKNYSYFIVCECVAIYSNDLCGRRHKIQFYFESISIFSKWNFSFFLSPCLQQFSPMVRQSFHHFFFKFLTLVFSSWTCLLCVHGAPQSVHLSGRWFLPKRGQPFVSFDVRH